MSNVATAVSSVLAAMPGEATGTSQETFPPKSKGARLVFANTAPLARLQEEFRSGKKQLQGSREPQEVAMEQMADSETKPVESSSTCDDALPQAGDAVVDLAEEGTISPTVAVPGDEFISSPGVQAEVSDVLGVDGERDGSLLWSRQRSNLAPQTTSGDGRLLSQTQVSTAVETGEKVLLVESAVTASVGKGDAQVSGAVLVQGKVPAGGQDGQASTPTPVSALGAEGPKEALVDAARGIGQGRTGTAMGEEMKAAITESGVSGISKSVEMHAVAASQSSAKPDGQATRDGAIDLNLDDATLTARASTMPESSSHGAHHEEEQAFSRQASNAQPAEVAVEVAAGARAAKETPIADFKESLHSPIDLAASSEGDPINTSSRLSAQMASPAGLDASSLRSPVQDVGEQILSSVHASIARADKQVQIRLNPPELGSVLVRVHEQGDQIRGTIEAIYDETRREIERALPQVLSRLEEAGIQIRRLEVVVSDQPDKGLGREQLQQDGGAQQQQDLGRRGHLQDASRESGLPTADFGVGHQDQLMMDNPRSTGGDGILDRIDVLM